MKSQDFEISLRDKFLDGLLMQKKYQTINLKKCKELHGNRKSI